MLIFPQLTALDFVGPYEVFTKAGCFDILITAATDGLIEAEGGLKIEAPYTLERCPPCDILFVPGGRGVTSLLSDTQHVNFIKAQAMHAKYVTSVCTGSLLLAAAGALKDHKATTHWRSLPLLKMFGIDTVDARVVIDGNRITGAGVTSGIDFALTLTAAIAGEDVAKTIQLMIEYDPQPPFSEGSPKMASAGVLQRTTERSTALFEERKKIIANIINNQ